MEPIAHRARGFAAAREWEILQEVRMSPDERIAVAAELRRRAFPADAPDVREAERTR